MPDVGWRTFAKNNNLTFKPETFLFRDAHVTGSYGRYQFRLETVFRHSRFAYDFFSRQIYTRMILQATIPVTANSTNRALDKSKIFDWLLPATIKQDIKGRFFAYESGQQIVYEQEYIETDVEYLQTILGLLTGLIENYPLVLELGAEVIPVLHPISKKYHSLQHVAAQLIFYIGQTTTQQLKKQALHLLCPHCLVHCGVHQVNVPWAGDVKYYGCRVCGQSRNLINSENCRLIVELDRNSLDEQRNQEMAIWINWIRYPKLFDFEAVEIIRASDEDVERFAVQVGNDTDPIRRERYKQIECRVSTECGLSENTMRILQRMFGSVEITEGLGVHR